MVPTDEDITNYIQQLTEQEKMVLQIAIEHLGTSFDIVKSIGFLDWFGRKK